MRVKKESKKTGLKLNVQKTKITASGPTTSWQIDGETMQTVRDFIFFYLFIFLNQSMIIYWIFIIGLILC